MSRYFTRPRSAKPLFIETPLWDDAEPQRLHLDVPEHEAVETGLIDVRGEPIMRAPNPVGFGRDREW